jgi:hypothetical protein
MTLTGGGYVPLGQAGEGSVAKFNSHHDERGRFATTDGAASAGRTTANAQTAELDRDDAREDSRSAPKGSQTQQALITCDELWDSDWAICNSSTFAEDRYNYKQCMIGLLQRNKECLAGLPLSPLLPY